MKKFIIATLVALLSTGSFANVNFDGIKTNLTGIYTGLEGVVTDYSGTDEVFGTGDGSLDAVQQGANTFVDAYRAATGELSFNADTWTLLNTSTGVDTLEDARDDLVIAQNNLVTQIQSDLIGDGTIANTWGTGEIADAIARGGLLGTLTASIQVSARDLSDNVATTDVQALYEATGDLEGFFQNTSVEAANLQTRVNTTRSAVADARDGFVLSNTVLATGNTGSIEVSAGETDLVDSILTNSTHTYIQVSDYFSAAIAVNDLGAITDTFTSTSAGQYTFNGLGYDSFTNFVLGTDNSTVTLLADNSSIAYNNDYQLIENADGSITISYVGPDYAHGTVGNATSNGDGSYTNTGVYGTSTDGATYSSIVVYLDWLIVGSAAYIIPAS